MEERSDEQMTGGEGRGPVDCVWRSELRSPSRRSPTGLMRDGDLDERGKRANERSEVSERGQRSLVLKK